MKKDVQRLDIVQVVPGGGVPLFDASLVVVTEVRAWGIQGFAQVPGQDGGRAYIRLRWDQFEPTGGRAVFVPADEMEREE